MQTQSRGCGQLMKKIWKTQTKTNEDYDDEIDDKDSARLNFGV